MQSVVFRVAARTFALSIVLCGIALAASPGDSTSPSVGSYGFDWLHPAKAKCAAVTPKNNATFVACEHKPEGGAFGLSIPYFVCHPKKGTEFLVYATKDQCIEAKETMEANAP
jgi:hypothetical protein